MNGIKRVGSCFLLALFVMILHGSWASAVPLVMTIDQSASSLTLNGQLGTFPFLEQAPGSKTTSYTGTITVDANNLVSPSTISILSAVADADVNGVWLPKLGGSTGPTDANPFPAAPGDYGVKAQFAGNDAAFAAARGVVLDIASGPEAVGGGGLFNSSETVAVLAGVFDSWVHPQLGGGGGQDNTAGDIYPRDATMPTMSSYVVSGGIATLTIPIRALRDEDPTDPDFTSFTGTLVATAAIPEPSSIVLLGTAITAVLAARRRRNALK